jgi:Ca2+/Na+ antiporter
LKCNNFIFRIKKLNYKIAPDVFSAIAAIGNSKEGDSGLAFGALFGAGVFVSTVIVGIICFIKPFYRLLYNISRFFIIIS